MTPAHQALETQNAVAALERIVRESFNEEDGYWRNIAGRDVGSAPATRTGGQSRLHRPFPMLRDRDEGRYSPFFEEERDLERMRAKCRSLATYTSVSTGALQALNVYVMGGEWEYKVQAREGQAPAEAFVREVQVVLDAIMERNSFVGDLDREIHDASREDGEAPIAVYAAPDGTCDFRRLDADNLRQPQSCTPLDRWLRCEPKHSSWTFGVHTLYDPRMSRIDHERHAGYHVVFEDGGTEWDYLPAWPHKIGDDDLDGKFMHLVKRNTPRRAKRGISDFWPILDDLEREDRLSENLSVGSAIMAAIAYFVKTGKSTNREAAESSLTRGLNAYARAMTAARGGERKVQTYKPGTVLTHDDGREYSMGPMGAVRQPIYMEVCQHLLRRIGLRWNFPEYMISGDASNANFSSTLVSESPFVKAREADQGFYVQQFTLLLFKSLKLAFDAGRFSSYCRSWTEFVALIDLTIKPPMVASRDKTAHLAELRDLWTAGLIDGNEYRTDLRREPKDELEGKTGGGPSPMEMQAALAQTGAGGAGSPGQSGGPQPALSQSPQQQAAADDSRQRQAPGEEQDEDGPRPVRHREARLRAAAMGAALESAHTLEEARALGRRFTLVAEASGPAE